MMLVETESRENRPSAAAHRVQKPATEYVGVVIKKPGTVREEPTANRHPISLVEARHQACEPKPGEDPKGPI